MSRSIFSNRQGTLDPFQSGMHRANDAPAPGELAPEPEEDHGDDEFDPDDGYTQ